MIVVAAIVIIAVAVERLINPRELESVGIGLAVSVVASIVNAAVAWQLIRVGRRFRSLTLEADGKHLMTDVWTTAGVIAGVALVALTGWIVLDPVIAIVVAINIVFVGYRLIKRSTMGLMDAAIPEEERAKVDAVLDSFRTDGVDFHDVRTREAGHIRFVQLHMLVPGAWSVQEGHDLLEKVEGQLHAQIEDVVPTIHLEPIEDPRSYESWRR